MSISSKVLEIYQKYYICPNCLGRMWALLGTNTTNIERGTSILLYLTLKNHKRLLSSNTNDEKEAIENLKLLATKASYEPAQKVLKNEGIDISDYESDMS